VPSSTTCLNTSIADVRALRAAAFAPRVVALTLIVVSPVAIAAGSSRAVLGWMAAGALVLWLLKLDGAGAGVGAAAGAGAL